MGLEEREGTLERVSENGVLLGGERLSYSKWFDGPRLTEEALGCKVRVKVDVGTKCSFVKRILRIGDKVPDWKPSEAPKGAGGGNPERGGQGPGGPGRRFSPEEMELKREEGVRIARSVAVDRAITITRDGVAIEKIAPLARLIESYLLSGEFPVLGMPEEGAQPGLKLLPEAGAEAAPLQNVAGKSPQGIPEVSASTKEPRVAPSKARTSRPDPKAVNALFNEAKHAGILADWNAYLEFCRNLLATPLKSLYALGAEDFGRVDAALRQRIEAARSGKERAA